MYHLKTLFFVALLSSIAQTATAQNCLCEPLIQRPKAASVLCRASLAMAPGTTYGSMSPMREIPPRAVPIAASATHREHQTRGGE